MTDSYELTWRRDPSGDWRATDERDGALYSASRITSQPRDRQWLLTALPPGREAQFRSGFSSLTTARAAALATRCHLCVRHRPFATMEQDGRMDSWRCRDHEECAEVATARDAESRRITAEIRNTDMSEILVREAEDGPELVFRHDYGHGQKHGDVIRATERDLDRLLAMLLTRRANRAGHGGDPL